MISTKKGMASLYVVAFTTLFLGIISLSYIQVMLSESSSSLNSDLSQSAYDAALAGIEDGKVVEVMYNECKMYSNPSDHKVNNRDCGGPNGIIAMMEAGIESNSCDVIADVLGTSRSAATALSSDASESVTDQAYTCVTISDNPPDYQSLLNETHRLRVIPIRIRDNLGLTYNDIKGIELQWASSATDDDYGDDTYLYGNSLSDELIPLPRKSVAESSLPVLSFELFQTDENFNLGELDLNNDNNDGTDHAMIMLYPRGDAYYTNGDTSGDKHVTVTDSNGAEVPGNYTSTYVTAKNLLDASNKNSSVARNGGSVENSVTPKTVYCGNSSGSRCRTVIEFPPTYQGGDNPDSWTRAASTFMLRVALPYGTPETDFTIRLCTEIENGLCTKRVNFAGVQSIIDSTGRANTLYRRILARVELLNSGLYPEFALRVDGQDAMIEKQFYVTENCWYSDENGNFATCSNNGDASNKL